MCRKLVTGTWTLSDTAIVRRDIFQETIRTYAAAHGTVLSASASATVDSLFDVDQFTDKELTGAFGKTVSAKATGFDDDVEGGTTFAGPTSETKLVPAGTYNYTMTLFVEAKSSGVAEAVAQLGNAGFDLVVVPEPRMECLAGFPGLLALGCLARRARK